MRTVWSDRSFGEHLDPHGEVGEPLEEEELALASGRRSRREQSLRLLANEETACVSPNGEYPWGERSVRDPSLMMVRQ